MEGIEGVWASMDENMIKAMVHLMQGRVKMMLELKGAAIIGSGISMQMQLLQKIQKKRRNLKLNQFVFTYVRVYFYGLSLLSIFYSMIHQLFTTKTRFANSHIEQENEFQNSCIITYCRPFMCRHSIHPLPLDWAGIQMMIDLSHQKQEKQPMPL